MLGFGLDLLWDSARLILLSCTAVKYLFKQIMQHTIHFYFLSLMLAFGWPIELVLIM